MSPIISPQETRLVLIDGHALIFRAFYGLPLMTSPTGEFTNAVYGFTRILLNVLDELSPTHLAIAFDSPGGTFRTKQYPQYKAQRPEPPEQLVPQIGLTSELVRAFNVPQFAIPGWEADDIIATLSTQATRLVNGQSQVVIVTGDLDLLQLVDDQRHVQVYVPGMKGKEAVVYNQKRVVTKLGIPRHLVPDYKGLSGDSSDNIPGIRGIGPKTAVKLLNQFGSLEGIYQAIAVGKTEEIGKSVLGKLIEGEQIAKLSAQLATISDQAPLKVDLDACVIHDYDKAKVVEMFGRLGFKSLMGRLPDDQFERGVQEALF